jgi:hypothetical protein
MLITWMINIPPLGVISVRSQQATFTAYLTDHLQQMIQQMRGVRKKYPSKRHTVIGNNNGNKRFVSMLCNCKRTGHKNTIVAPKSTPTTEICIVAKSDDNDPTGGYVSNAKGYIHGSDQHLHTTKRPRTPYYVNVC